MGKEIDLYQISLKVIVKNDRNEVLVLKAGDEGSYAGFYDLPGGRIDIDEFTIPFIEIAKREIIEEVGDIACTFKQKPVALGRHSIPASLTSDGKEIHVAYLFFEAHYVGGEIHTSEEHTGHMWIDLHAIDLKKYFTSGILEGVCMYLGK